MTSKATSKTKTDPQNWRTKYPVHDAADLFPLLEGQSFDDLVEDIRRHGLRDKIVRTVDEKILDGRNRLRACLAAGVEPKFETFRGPGKAFQYVISVNLHRRHLDTSQRAMIAAKIATLEQGARTDLRQNYLMSQNDAAELLKVSPMSVKHAKRVVDHGTPELVAAVRDGHIKVSKAAKDVASLTPAVQREVVRQAKRGTKPAAVVPTNGSNGHASYQLGAAMRRIGEMVRAEWAQCPTTSRGDFLAGLQHLHDLLKRDPKPIVILLGRRKQTRQRKGAAS